MLGVSPRAKRQPLDLDGADRHGARHEVGLVDLDLQPGNRDERIGAPGLEHLEAGDSHVTAHGAAFEAAGSELDRQRRRDVHAAGARSGRRAGQVGMQGPQIEAVDGDACRHRERVERDRVARHGDRRAVQLERHLEGAGPGVAAHRQAARLEVHVVDPPLALGRRRHVVQQRGETVQGYPIEHDRPLRGRRRVRRFLGAAEALQDVLEVEFRGAAAQDAHRRRHQADLPDPDRAGQERQVVEPDIQPLELDGALVPAGLEDLAALQREVAGEEIQVHVLERQRAPREPGSLTLGDPTHDLREHREADADRHDQHGENRDQDLAGAARQPEHHTSTSTFMTGPPPSASSIPRWSASSGIRRLTNGPTGTAPPATRRIASSQSARA